LKRIRAAFTLSELLISTGIILTLAAIAYPIYARAKASAYASECLSNIRQIGQAELLYASSNDGEFATQTNPRLHPWPDQLHLASHRSAALLGCPTADKNEPGNSAGGYAINACLYFKEENIAEPTRIVVVAESACVTDEASRNAGNSIPACPSKISAPDSIIGALGSGSTEASLHIKPLRSWGSERHFGKGNYFFADGHALAVAPTRFRVPKHALLCNAGAPEFIGPDDGYMFAITPIKATN